MEIILKALNTSAQFFTGLILTAMAVQLAIVFFVIYADDKEERRGNWIIGGLFFMLAGMAGILYTSVIVKAHCSLICVRPETGWQHEGIVLFLDMLTASAAVPLFSAITKALIIGARCFSYDRNMLFAGYMAGHELARTLSNAIYFIEDSFKDFEGEGIC